MRIVAVVFIVVALVLAVGGDSGGCRRCCGDLRAESVMHKHSVTSPPPHHCNSQIRFTI